MKVKMLSIFYYNMTCKFENCKIHSCFNYEGERPKYCFSRKEPEMINVRSKTCEPTGCKTQPCYNYKGEKK